MNGEQIIAYYALANGVQVSSGETALAVLDAVYVRSLEGKL